MEADGGNVIEAVIIRNTTGNSWQTKVGDKSVHFLSFMQFLCPIFMNSEYLNFFFL